MDGIREHTLTPVLFMFPLGLLMVAVILDVFEVLGGPAVIGTLGYCTVAAGVVSGVARTLARRIDDLSAHHQADAGSSARRFLLDGTVLLFFAVIVLLRMRTPERTVGPGLLALEFLGLGVAAASALAGALPALAGRALRETGTVRLTDLLDNPEPQR
jgi:uncharacterized membrane protein